MQLGVVIKLMTWFTVVFYSGDQKVHEAMKHFGDLTDQARYIQI